MPTVRKYLLLRAFTTDAGVYVTRDNLDQVIDRLTDRDERIKNGYIQIYDEFVPDPKEYESGAPVTEAAMLHPPSSPTVEPLPVEQEAQEITIEVPKASEQPRRTKTKEK